MSDSNNHLYKGDDFGRNFLNSPVAATGLIDDSLRTPLASCKDNQYLKAITAPHPLQRMKSEFINKQYFLII